MTMAEKARLAAELMMAFLSPVLGAFAIISHYLPDQHIGASGTPGPPIPKISGIPGGGGGGRGGGGGASAKDTAEQDRQKEIQAYEKANQQRLASYRAYLAEELADLKLNKSLELATEQQYIDQSGALKLKDLLFEKQLLQDELDTQRLNDDEKHDIAVKQQILDRQIGAERKKISKETVDQTIKEVDAENKKHEAEKKHLQEIKELKARHFHEELLHQLEIKRGLEDEAKARSLAGIAAQAGGNFISDISDKLDADGNVVSKGLGVIGSAFQQLKEIGLQAMGALANGIGAMVAQWVLLGNSGGQTFKKLAATILASVSQQATAMAVMCLAYAALATTAWGAAMLGGSPGQFLQAAALFGAVAAVTAGIGRAVAGDSFNQQAGAGGGAGGAQQVQQQNNFTTGFSGFLGPIHATLNRLEETTHLLAAKITGMSPEDVVTIGVDGAAFAVRDSLFKAIDHDGAGSTGTFARLTGQAR
jgi:hypothetical protein